MQTITEKQSSETSKKFIRRNYHTPSKIKDHLEFSTIEATRQNHSALSVYNPQTTSAHKNQLKTIQKFNLTIREQEKAFNLPKIKQKQTKRGSFLQNWLDEALNSDPTMKVSDSNQQINGPLKNVRGYELDKLYLQSQNIPADTVQQLYSSLYVYTHGIDKVFKELMSAIKLKKNQQLDIGSTQGRLINSFWRAFIKLLQNLTSYQTVYQAIQKKHFSKINDLKEKILSNNEKFQQKSREYEQTIYKLTKDHEQQSFKLTKLQTDFKILDSTNKLTDRTLMEEVTLRLQFEEKINSVYTSYHQLKTKYEALVDKLQLATHFSSEQSTRETILKRQIEQWAVKYNSLQLQIELWKSKAEQRQNELAIKIQEVEDIKMNNALKEEKQLQGQDFINNLIFKQKMLQGKIAELTNRDEANSKLLKEKERIIEDLKKRILDTRQKNDELYINKADLQKQITNLKDIISRLNYHNETQKVQIEKKDADSIALISKNEIQANTIANLQQKIQTLNKNLAHQSETLAKSNILLAQMKAVKDKYERINVLLNKDKKDLEKTAKQAISSTSQMQEEVQGMKMLMQNKDTRIKELQTSLMRQKQLATSKLNAANNNLTKKQALILSYQKLTSETKQKLETKNSEIDKLEKRIIDIKKQKKNLDIELSTTRKQLQIQTKQKDECQRIIRALSSDLGTKVLQIDNLSGDLGKKKHILQTTKKQKSSEFLSISSLLEQYKQLVKKKAQFVHPMIYEDCRMAVVRAQDILLQNGKIVQLAKQQANSQRQKNKEFQAQIKKITQQKQSLLKQIKALHQTIQQEKQQKNVILRKIQLLNSEFETKVSIINEKHEKEISKIMSNEAILQNEIKELSKKISNLEQELKKCKRKADVAESKLYKLQNIEKIHQSTQTDPEIGKNKSLTFTRQMFKPSTPSRIHDQEVQTSMDMEIINSQQDQQGQELHHKYGGNQKLKQSQQINRQKKTIETKNMRKALKLTYMRR